jgi:small subunit ribosomal protein S8
LEEKAKMSMTDPIADMLTRIRNAQHARHRRVDVPASRMKTSIAKILQAEGYITNSRTIEEEKKAVLRIFLKYEDTRGSGVIRGLERVSKPGRRVYVSCETIPRVRGGYGTSILSTSHGLMTGVQARQKGVGGELLCQVW